MLAGKNKNILKNQSQNYRHRFIGEKNRPVALWLWENRLSSHSVVGFKVEFMDSVPKRILQTSGLAHIKMYRMGAVVVYLTHTNLRLVSEILTLYIALYRDRCTLRSSFDQHSLFKRIWVCYTPEMVRQSTEKSAEYLTEDIQIFIIFCFCKCFFAF